MIHRERWGCNPSWLAWVLRVWEPDRGRVQQQHEGAPEREEFAEAARAAFVALGIPTVHVKTWVSIQHPEPGEGYTSGYPHVHHPLDATTLVHYLQTGADPAPLHILDGDQVVETITPSPGLVVFMPNSVRHGVLRHHDPVFRVQLIATALRR